MRLLIIMLFGIFLMPGVSYATDWNQTRSQLELLQKVLEEKARAKREGRKADMNRIQREADQIQADKLRRHQQQQAVQRRQAEQRRQAQERAYKNSAQYKHNQELMKAFKNEGTYGYGGSGSTAARSNSTRYRPPQKTTPGYQAPKSTSPKPRSTYKPAEPTGITTNPSRSAYTPSNTYDADDLDASGIGLHDVPSSSTRTSASTGSSGSTWGAPEAGKCLESVEVEPYECGLFGMGGSTCTSRCIRREYK